MLSRLIRWLFVPDTESEYVIYDYIVTEGGRRIPVGEWRDKA